jgi:chorismate dehydratase
VNSVNLESNKQGMAFGNPSATGFRIGVIPFLNVQPLLWGLERTHTIVTIPPSRMGLALEEGLVDVAIAPVAASMLNAKLVRVGAACIASRGKVQSVRLLHPKPLDTVRLLWADSNSQTSVLLSRLILKRWYGVERLDVRTASIPAFRTDKIRPGEACLQIGDAALIAPPVGLTVTDLGEEWFRRTGRSFVFAVWTARNEETAHRVFAPLSEAKKEGVRHFDDIVKSYRGFREFDRPRLKEYLEKSLVFDFGPEEERGLSEFERLLAGEKVS